MRVLRTKTPQKRQKQEAKSLSTFRGRRLPKTAMTDKSNEIYEPEALSKIPKKFTYVRNSLNEGWERLQAW